MIPSPRPLPPRPILTITAHLTFPSHAMTYHHRFLLTLLQLRLAQALAVCAASCAALAAADGPPPHINLCVIVAATDDEPVALELVRRVVGTDAEAGGLPAGSTLRVYRSTPAGLAEVAGPVRILDTAVETVEAEGNGLEIARLLDRLGGHDAPVIAPLLVPAAVDYLARYAPPAAPEDAGAVVTLGRWTFGEENPDPGMVPTEALMAQVEPRESPYGCARSAALPASWFAFAAGPATTPWGTAVLSAYLRHRGAALRDAIPTVPAAEAIVTALRRAPLIAPLPSALPERPDGRPGFVRVAAPSGDAAVSLATAMDAVRAAAPLPGLDLKPGEPVVVAPLPVAAPTSGPLVASLVWYEDDARGPKPIAADLDLWLAQGRDRLNFNVPRCAGGNLSTDLTSQGDNLQSEVVEFAAAGADAVLGVNVYRNATGKTALATLRVSWMGGVARLNMALPGSGQRIVGGDAEASPGNGFRIRLGDLFGMRKPSAAARDEHRAP